MAKTGRPKNSNDMSMLIQRMLKKRDVIFKGKKAKRLDVLIEILWLRVFSSQGKDKEALRFILSYGFGTPTTPDKMPTQEDVKLKKKDDIVELPESIVNLITEIEAEGTECGGTDEKS